jgi:hypothetical protein
MFLSMESSLDSSPIMPDQRRHRSSVTNGIRLFAIPGLDGRTQTARRYRDLIDSVTSDLGGDDHISELERQLIRRHAAVAVAAETLEADLVRNLPVNMGDLGILIDRQRRLAETLGLGRRARPVEDDLDRVLDRVAKRRAEHRVETRLGRHGGGNG